jgi:hypothetical protein
VFFLGFFFFFDIPQSTMPYNHFGKLVKKTRKSYSVVLGVDEYSAEELEAEEMYSDINE